MDPVPRQTPVESSGSQACRKKTIHERGDKPALWNPYPYPIGPRRCNSIALVAGARG